ncbi:hypothetical protein BKA93DRAFT_729265, partial [Sparassis latifolia]
LATRLYLLAAIYGDIAERHRLSQESGVADLKAIMTDMKIRLDDSFKFTTEQRANIRGIAQDVVYQANRTSFGMMNLSVEKILRADVINIKLENVYGIPAREKLLISLIRKTCSSVRNAFRQDIHDSILGTSQAGITSLTDFTLKSAMKYKHGGAGEKLDLAFTIHNVILVSTYSPASLSTT